MYWASDKFIWIPLYVFFLCLVYKHVGKRVWLVILAALLLIVLSDQISNRGFKNNFKSPISDKWLQLLELFDCDLHAATPRLAALQGRESL